MFHENKPMHKNFRIYSNPLLPFGLIHYTWDGLFYISRDYSLTFSNYDVYLSLKIIFILANSEDADVLPHSAAIHLGLHCMSKYPFRGFQYNKG